MYIDDELYRRMVRLKVRCGFRNLQELNRAAWRMLIYLYDEQRVSGEEANDVREMFDSFAAWEAREFGVVPQRRRNNHVE